MGGSSQLLEWLHCELPKNSCERSLVVASSSAGAAALRRTLAERRGALLGVDFVTPRGLALEVLALGGVYRSDVRPDPLEEREVLRQMLPKNAVGDYASRFDSALTHLLRTIHEVQALGPGTDTDSDAGRIVELTQEFSAAFQDAGTTNNLISAAIHHVARGGISLPDRVLLVGYQDPDQNLLLLLQVLEGEGVSVSQSPTSNTVPESIRRISCANPLAELRLAARRCTDTGAEGSPWHRMVVAAPDLVPYLADLRFAFDQEGVPFHTSAEAPLIQRPRPALCLHLCELVFGEGPATSFLSLAASPLLLQRTSPTEQAEFETVVRRHAVRGTGPDTREQVRRLAGRLSRQSPLTVLLGDVLDAADRGRSEQSNRGRSAILTTFMNRHLQPPTSDEVDAAERLDECLRAAEFADSRCKTGEEFCAELQQLIKARSIPIEGSTKGGVHFVSTRDALAIPCSHLHILGLTERATTGTTPCTTFISEADREVLRMRTTDVMRQTEARQLSHLLRHAPRLLLSYPRTDADGQRQEFTPSIRRLVDSIPLPPEEREPSHPQTLAHRAVRSGRCPVDLAVAHLALGGCDDPKVYRRLLEFDPTPTLDRVAKLESFRSDDLALDGDIGPTIGRALLDVPYSVTRFERLTRCPQQFFFETVLRVQPLEEEPEPMGMSSLETGQHVHAVLERLYEEFLAQLKSTKAPTQLAGAMQERAAALLAEELATTEPPLAREFPGLHKLTERQLLAGLRLAIAEDLDVMGEDGSRPQSVEQKLTSELLFTHAAETDPIRLLVTGKLDRVDDLPGGGIRVLDYKTGTKPENQVSPLQTLRGRRLQLVLYGMLARTATSENPEQLEVRSVRPRRAMDPTKPEHRFELRNASEFLTGKLRDGMHETLAIFARLIRRGMFIPIDDHHCSYCSYRPACRRYHPPSRERVLGCESPEVREFRSLAGKTLKESVLPRESLR